MVFNASVVNGLFKRVSDYAFARPTNVMSTKSSTCFEWSVKLVGKGLFHVGIAAQFKRHMGAIFLYDKNAILYRSYCGSLSPAISVGSNKIYTSLPKHNTGDVIRFKFQPHTKKLIINLVRL